MPLDVDVETFLHNLKATKPPYECPRHGCGRIYKSFSGIQAHLENFDHSAPSSGQTPKSARKKGKYRRGADRTPSPTHSQQTARDPIISYVHSTKRVEIDNGDMPLSFHIEDRLPLLDKEEFETGTRGEDLATVLPAAVSTTAVPASGDQCVHLPQADFSSDDDFDLPDAQPMPNNYIRFIEKCGEELDDEIEYDIDDEDDAWLHAINERRLRRGLSPVSQAHLELLIDRLEKESFFQAQTTMGTNVLPTDEEAVCCICMDGECENSNAILFCDMCNIAVHQECYGVPYIPEGQWWCRRCLQSPSRAVDCVLCPNKGGAFKQTDDGRWAHVVCALWVPEVCFANTVFLEPIDSIDRIPAARWKLSCFICKQRSSGACIQCHRANCYTGFHVTCAQQAGVHMKIDAVRECSPTGPVFTVRKAAYCDVHTPSDSDARPIVECNSVMSGLTTGSSRKHQAKSDHRLKTRKARKILAERRSAVPVVSVPTIPPERIQQLASLVDYSQRNHFIQRLLAFWTLKRYSRNGVPLLRRLQVSNNKQPPRRSLETICGANPISSESAPISASSAVVISTQHLPSDTLNLDAKTELRRQLQCWHRLRQDLEKVRLLCELVRKREKAKRELVKCQESETRIRLSPLHYFLGSVMLQLSVKDQTQIFAEPVDTNEVSDYMSVISQPMDLSTMRQRVTSRHYWSLDELAADFELMIKNCLTYNTTGTVFHRAALRMRQLGGVILRRSRRDMEALRLDDNTCHVPSQSGRCETHSARLFGTDEAVEDCIS